jgi:hypothetical protein
MVNVNIMSDSITLRNQKAQENGEWGEQRAGKILSTKYANVQQVNDIMDFLVNHKIPIEVKTCQKLIKTGVEKYAERNGRFVLNLEQDAYLKLNNGLYIFIVKNDNLVFGYKMMAAKDIPYRRNLPWNKIIER